MEDNELLEELRKKFDGLVEALSGLGTLEMSRAISRLKDQHSKGLKELQLEYVRRKEFDGEERAKGVLEDIDSHVRLMTFLGQLQHFVSTLHIYGDTDPTIFGSGEKLSFGDALLAVAATKKRKGKK